MSDIDLGADPAGFQLNISTGVYALLAGILIFAASDPIYPLLMKGPSEWVLDVPGLDGARRLAWLAIYMVMLTLMVAIARWWMVVLANQHWFFLATGYFILSSLWSDNPMDGVVAGVQALFTMAFGIMIGVRLGAEGIVKAFFVAGVLVVAFSLIFVVAFPLHAFGYRYNHGALRGVYVEKNHLALFLSYSVWAAVFMCFYKPNSWALKAFAVLTAVLCVMAVSSIALLQMMLIGFCAGYFLLFRHVQHRGVIAFFILFCALAFLSMALPVILGLLGENMTFNGRTILWGHLWGFISEHPFLGHGYRGFWHTAEAEQMRSILGWPAHGAHNVWLQAMLAGGLIGFSLWAIQWWGVLQRAVTMFGNSQDHMQVAMTVLIFMTFLWSLFETTQLQHFTHNAIVTGMVFAIRSPGFR